MTTPDYSKGALTRFCGIVADQGLVNKNTASGWAVAVARLLEDLSDTDDVRTVDVATAIKRYHNRHPGDLKGTVLKEYERRLTRVLADFQQYTDDPTKYEGRGRGPSTGNGDAAKPTKRKSANQSITPVTGSLTTAGAAPKLTPVAGLSLEFPMRIDFLAQVVIPRDMKSDEARRLSRFIMSLAVDDVPKSEGQ